MMSKIPLKQIAGAQPIAPNLTAVSSISDQSTGLVEKTGVGTMGVLNPSTVGRQLITGDAAAGRSAIGLNSWLNMSKATITIPLALVPQNQREIIDCDGNWSRLTYVSYSGLGAILNKYPDASGKNFDFKLMIFGENQVINQDIDWESQPWWNPASNAYLGKMEYRVKKDWGNGYEDPIFMPAQRYEEYWGAASNGSTMAILPVIIPNPELNGYPDYWSLEIRGLQKYPNLRPFPKWSIYAAFLIGTTL